MFRYQIIENTSLLRYNTGIMIANSSLSYNFRTVFITVCLFRRINFFRIVRMLYEKVICTNWYIYHTSSWPNFRSNMAKGPTGPWKPPPLDTPPPPPPLWDVSQSCFCIIASEILFAFKKSRMEIISSEFLRPSESLSGSTVTLCALVEPLDLECRWRWPGVIAFLRPVDFFGRRLHRQFIFWISQFKNCLITMDVTLNRLYIQQHPITMKIKFPIRYNCT